MLLPRLSEPPPFSLDPALLADILRHARPLGHHEDAANLNIGFGFLYYGLVRTLRPKHIVVIGSGFGFSVVCLALGLKDNGAGVVSFVDPSYSALKDGLLHTVGGTDQWGEPGKVRDHFARFGVSNQVRHYKMTSADFFSGYRDFALPGIDLAFIDGNHSFTDVRHDFMAVLRNSHRNAYMLLHDTNIFMRELVRHAGVKRWLRHIGRDPKAFEIVDFPFSSGVALVRILCDASWQPRP
jgi:hypothetical protein